MPPVLSTTWEQRRRLEQLDTAARTQWQLDKLHQLLAVILPHNAFYARRLAGHPLPPADLDQFREFPYTTKQELADEADEAGYAANRTYPLTEYARFHRTSGTQGRPLAVLDTAADWAWWIDTWQYVLDAADIGPHDRVLMAFSFGPFIGFWSAYDAVVARGALVMPTGGMNSIARVELAASTQATAIFCTPTYALHLAEVAHDRGLDLTRIGVRRLVVAGEPGGSVPAIRQRIEAAWGAQVIDHCGATEVGPWGYADAARCGVHVCESEFLAEFLAVEHAGTAGEGELSELVLTTLGRTGSPVIRYRTGDLVRPHWPTTGENRFVLLKGGVLGRVDDMLIIRGVNIYPSSIEHILRTFPEVVEYRLIADRHEELDRLTIELEDRLGDPQRISRELQLRMGLKIDVRAVPVGSLPRFEGKGRRFVDRRTTVEPQG